MVKYKVNTPDEAHDFVVTRAYKRLYEQLNDLKTHKGRIVHVIGAPGTGKSSNLYEAIKSLDLNVYSAVLVLDDTSQSSFEVYHEFFDTLKEDMKVGNMEEVHRKASQYDAILFADKFHDAHYLYDGKVGFSSWMNDKGIRAFPFYLLLILHYLRNIFKFRRINLVFQTSWAVKRNGVKYDLFTDFGLFSRLLTSTLKLFFVVVEISYTESEIMEIVKKHLPDADEEEVKSLVKQHGSRVRFILQSLNESKKRVDQSLNESQKNV